MIVPSTTPFDAKLFQILGALRYNSERAEPLEAVLTRFLLTKDVSMDLRGGVRSIQKDQRDKFGHTSGLSSAKQEELLKSRWFQQECLLSANIPSGYVPEHVASKFGPFEEPFEGGRPEEEEVEDKTESVGHKKQESGWDIMQRRMPNSKAVADRLNRAVKAGRGENYIRSLHSPWRYWEKRSK